MFVLRARFVLFGFVVFDFVVFLAFSILLLWVLGCCVWVCYTAISCLRWVCVFGRFALMCLSDFRVLRF